MRRKYNYFVALHQRPDNLNLDDARVQNNMGCNGIAGCRFDTVVRKELARFAANHYHARHVAQVAELVDALASGASVHLDVEVQVLSWHHSFKRLIRKVRPFCVRSKFTMGFTSARRHSRLEHSPRRLAGSARCASNAQLTLSLANLILKDEPKGSAFFVSVRNLSRFTSAKEDSRPRA